jgi:hypothetical protein
MAIDRLGRASSRASHAIILLMLDAGQEAPAHSDALDMLIPRLLKRRQFLLVAAFEIGESGLVIQSKLDQQA